MKLTHNNIEQIFFECSTNPNNDSIVIEGVLNKFTFSKDSLMRNKDNILQMLMCLPEEFYLTIGQGASLLIACKDTYGSQWTDSQCTMEKLFALGLAIDKVKCLFPKDKWFLLPGGMPYYVVINEE